MEKAPGPPSMTWRRCSTKSTSTWNSRSPYGIGDVVRPRAVTYSGTCHQWLSGGARASRTLPTIWSHMCRVEIVGSQSRHGSSGHGPGLALDGSRLTPAIRRPSSFTGGLPIALIHVRAVVDGVLAVGLA